MPQAAAARALTQKEKGAGPHLRYSLLKSLVLLCIQRLLAPVSAAYGDCS